MTTLSPTPDLRLRRTRAVRFKRCGPAFVAAIAYVDPGNVVTNMTAGARYGTKLLWVVVLATVIAGPVQYLAAKLGATTGRSLPQLIAGRYSPPRRLAYWAQAEIVSIATDLAEVVGAAIALHLLFAVPLPLGGVIAAASGAVLLALGDRWGERFLRRVSAASLAVIGGAFLMCLLIVPPAPIELASGLAPSLPGGGALVLAAGIVGATIMPHAVHVHTDLARGHRRLASHRTDVMTAMLIAGMTNAMMLVVGASALRGSVGEDFSGIASELAERIGPAAQVAFLVALLVSGVTSTAVGTQSGAVVMNGLLLRPVPALARRLATVLPVVILLAVGVPPVTMLIVSQVVLAVGLPLVLVPMLSLTSSRSVMGARVNHRAVTAAMSLVTAAVVVLDAALLVDVLLD
ncbi:Nramp family divalent metal transporter [Peterkaempfera griseoplana]|uniref:Nramp family divalent metal transporter n=1 Tax=Peterkaempfera griseoplana TaxID=66896 RepID=UPI0006E261DA|nr:Nramp family divalent metal transporter [Peterkaempfera griseoplana]